MKISITKLEKAFANVGVKSFNLKDNPNNSAKAWNVWTWAVWRKTICSWNISK